MNEEQVRQIMREELARYQQFQNPTFKKHIVLQNGVDFIGSGDKGNRLGTSASEKWSFFGATPIVRPSAITPPSGGGTQDSQARTAINSLITTLQTLGLIS